MNNENAQEGQYEIVTTTPTALESMERAGIDMQISTAKRYPRSLAVVKKRMLDLATLDQETAASCFYRLNRQGRNIEGPTIRLAEIAVSSFGNLRYGARVISNDKKVITAQGYCFDLESNVMSQVEVQRRITDKNGNTYSDDMQVVTGNAACAIAARNAVFKVVPFAFIKPIFSAAKKAAVGDIKTLVERRTTMLKTFAALGVNEKRVLAVLGKNGLEEIGLAELEILIGLHNAIEDKEQTVEEAFPSVIIERAKINGNAAATATPPSDPAPTGEKSANPKGRKRAQQPQAQTPNAATEPPVNGATSSEALAKEDESLAVQVAVKLKEGGYDESELVELAIANNWCETTTKNLSQISETNLQVFVDNWQSTVTELDSQRADKAKKEKSPLD